MNPRVVVLTTYFRPVVGGVESNAERLARYLHGKKFAVQVVTKRVTPDLPDVANVEGVPIVRIGPLGERGPYGKWHFLPAALGWLIRQRAAYDVVCCVDYRGMGVAAVLARTMTGRPAILQAQTPGGLVSTAVTWPLIAIYRRADAFACISHALEREATQAGVPPERIHFLPNAVDTDRFKPGDQAERNTIREQLGVPVDSVLCLFVGRLSREKGLMELLEAWRSLAPSNGILLVAGPDMVAHAWDVGPAARSFVSRHGLVGSVRFLGSVSDVATLLRAVDVAIQPSHFEALGLSAVEALASGVPVVASSVGGLLDFVTEGENGKLAPPQNPEALAQALRPMIEDRELREGMARRARASVVGVYDERIVFARFGDLLRLLAEATA